MTAVEFEVIGVPAPQGSKKAFAVGGKARMTESNSLAHAAWRNAVAEKAREIVRLNTTRAYPLDGALSLTIVFHFPMPRSRPKIDRVRGWAHKTTAPDTSKLIRCVEDALQAAGLIVDDARFCEVRAVKREVLDEWTGATIVVATTRSEDEMMR